jgi:flavodoxin
MAKVAVVYNSGYGHTRRMARAVAEGAMAQSSSDSSPSEMLPGDLETAKVFGKRVAEVAAKFKG